MIIIEGEHLISHAELARRQGEREGEKGSK